MANSKSAYSISNKKQKFDTHIIVVWVDNEAGVLARVVGLFSGRGYNIESLAVAEVDAKLNISRILIDFPISSEIPQEYPVAFEARFETVSISLKDIITN